MNTFLGLARASIRCEGNLSRIETGQGLGLPPDFREGRDGQLTDYSRLGAGLKARPSRPRRIWRPNVG